MAKFMIITENGDILRTINLPYEGILVDISSMPDDEWESWYSKLYTVKVKMEEKGKYKKDHRGLPKIVNKDII